jgi:hypothetical protein
VSVRDITPDAVLAAVEAGCDTLFRLAERFEVLPHSAFLRDALAALEADGLIRCTVRPGTGTTFTSTRLTPAAKDRR